MVLMSITIVPGAAPSIMPPGPTMTCSTSGESDTQVMTISLPRAASLGEEAAAAPAPVRGFMRAGVRFHTVTWWPAFTRVHAHGRAYQSQTNEADSGHAESPGSAEAGAGAGESGGIIARRAAGAHRLSERIGAIRAAQRVRAVREPPLPGLGKVVV